MRLPATFLYYKANDVFSHDVHIGYADDCDLCCGDVDIRIKVRYASSEALSAVVSNVMRASLEQQRPLV